MANQPQKQAPDSKIEAGKESGPPEEKRSINYMRYSGMAFQMGAMIAIGAWLGSKIDAYFQVDRPYFAALFALLFTIAALYLTLKDLIWTKK